MFLLRCSWSRIYASGDNADMSKHKHHRCTSAAGGRDAGPESTPPVRRWAPPGHAGGRGFTGACQPPMFMHTGGGPYAYSMYRTDTFFPLMPIQRDGGFRRGQGPPRARGRGGGGGRGARSQGAAKPAAPLPEPKRNAGGDRSARPEGTEDAEEGAATPMDVARAANEAGTQKVPEATNRARRKPSNARQHVPRGLPTLPPVETRLVALTYPANRDISTAIGPRASDNMLIESSIEVTADERGLIFGKRMRMRNAIQEKLGVAKVTLNFPSSYEVGRFSIWTPKVLADDAKRLMKHILGKGRLDELEVARVEPLEFSCVSHGNHVVGSRVNIRKRACGRLKLPEDRTQLELFARMSGVTVGSVSKPNRPDSLCAVYIDGAAQDVELFRQLIHIFSVQTENERIVSMRYEDTVEDFFRGLHHYKTIDAGVHGESGGATATVDAGVHGESGGATATVDAGVHGESGGADRNSATGMRPVLFLVAGQARPTHTGGFLEMNRCSRQSSPLLRAAGAEPVPGPEKSTSQQGDVSAMDAEAQTSGAQGRRQPPTFAVYPTSDEQFMPMTLKVANTLRKTRHEEAIKKKVAYMFVGLLEAKYLEESQVHAFKQWCGDVIWNKVFTHVYSKPAYRKGWAEAMQHFLNHPEQVTLPKQGAEKRPCPSTDNTGREKRVRVEPNSVSERSPITITRWSKA